MLSNIDKERKKLVAAQSVSILHAQRRGPAPNYYPCASGNAVRPSSRSYSFNARGLCVGPPLEDVGDLFGRDDFELGVRAIAGRLVEAPAAELGGVAETVALHVVIGDFDDQLRPERLPAQIFAGGPATLAAGHSAAGGVSPLFPRVISERILAILR